MCRTRSRSRVASRRSRRAYPGTGASVAQVFNLLFRRLSVGRAFVFASVFGWPGTSVMLLACGLKTRPPSAVLLRPSSAVALLRTMERTGDTADWKVCATGSWSQGARSSGWGLSTNRPLTPALPIGWRERVSDLSAAASGAEAEGRVKGTGRLRGFSPQTRDRTGRRSSRRDPRTRTRPRPANWCGSVPRSSGRVSCRSRFRLRPAGP